MTTSYTAHFQGPNTEITEHPNGEWPRWHMARAAAIEHLRDHVRECEKTLGCVRRAGSFGEYRWLVGEMGAEAAQVYSADTLI